MNFIIEKINKSWHTLKGSQIQFSQAKHKKAQAPIKDYKSKLSFLDVCLWRGHWKSSSPAAAFVPYFFISTIRGWNGEKKRPRASIDWFYPAAPI
jgi:hypothetical protein